MICPNCGSRIEDITFMGLEEYDCRVYGVYEGHCSTCNCNWHWEDVYEFSESTIPYQIKENK